MKVLVTGGAGYIGSTLTASLLRRGVYTRVVDNLRFGGASLLKLYSYSGFDFLKGDIRRKSILRDAIERDMDAVIHLAAIVGDPACSRQPDLAMEVNHKATLNLVNLCRQRAIRRFIFISTCSNYGLRDTSRLAAENNPLNPLSIYAKTKVEAERYILTLADSDFHPCILRLATVYGISPRMRFDLLVNEFTRDAIVRKRLVVYGEQFWRPYVHVDDVANAITMILTSPIEKISGEIFNVGGNRENYRKRQIVDLILKHVPDARVEVVAQGADPRDYRVSFEKIRRTLSFNLKWCVEDGITQIKSAFEQGLFNHPFAKKYLNS